MYRSSGRPIGIVNKFLTRARAFSSSVAGSSSKSRYELVPSRPKSGIWQPLCHSCYAADLPAEVTGDQCLRQVLIIVEALQWT